MPARLTPPDCDVSVVVRTCDDEESVGAALVRLRAHLVTRKLHFELLVADEHSGDNTVAVATLLRAQVPELRVFHCPRGTGYFQVSQVARGRTLLLCDARSLSSLAGIGFALGRLHSGADVVAVSGRYLVMRRMRAWRAFPSLRSRARALLRIEKRFMRKSRSLGLQCQIVLRQAQDRRFRIPLMLSAARSPQSKHALV